MLEYEQLRQQGGWLVVGGRFNAQAVGWTLADAASRFRAAEHYAVAPLSEQEVRALLTRRARERGLAVAPVVLDYWLAHRNRALPSLLDDLERLDHAAWESQRRLTVPFMKGVLEA